MALRRVDELVLRSFYKVMKDLMVSEGYYVDPDLYADNQLAQYKAAKAIVLQNKGFYIDLFSQSSARYKGFKDTPRIVMFLSRVFEGDIGYSGPITIKKDQPGPAKFDQGVMPGKSSNLVIAVHLLSKTSEQTYTLNSLNSAAFGTRKSLKYYNDPTNRFWCIQTNFSELDNPIEDYTESIYFYTVPNALMHEVEIIRTDIAAISEIKVDIESNQTETDETTVN